MNKIILPTTLLLACSIFCAGPEEIFPLTTRDLSSLSTENKKYNLIDFLAEFDTDMSSLKKNLLSEEIFKLSRDELKAHMKCKAKLILVGMLLFKLKSEYRFHLNKNDKYLNSIISILQNSNSDDSQIVNLKNISKTQICLHNNISDAILHLDLELIKNNIDLNKNIQNFKDFKKSYEKIDAYNKAIAEVTSIFRDIKESPDYNAPFRNILSLKTCDELIDLETYHEFLNNILLENMPSLETYNELIHNQNDYLANMLNLKLCSIDTKEHLQSFNYKSDHSEIEESLKSQNESLNKIVESLSVLLGNIEDKYKT